MPQSMLVTVLTAILAVAAAGVSPRSQEQSTVRRVPEDVELLVRQALEDRVVGRDIPDGGLLQKGPRIAVREEMPRSKLKLGPGALPHVKGIEFYLLSETAAQVEADKTRQPVHFIIVDEPSIFGDSAALTMGTDVVLPRDPNRFKLCCCTSVAEFRWRENRWRLVRWDHAICS